MNNTEIQTILERVGAIITNSHIVYTSGRHGSSYINKDALYPHIAETSTLCAHIAAQFANASVDIVAGPTIGGVIMAQWVAHHLCERTGKEVLAVYAEEQQDNHGVRQRVFRRGYDELVQGKHVLIVEDVLTTGGSARQVVAAVEKACGTPVGVGALCNRGHVTASWLGVPRFVALVTMDLESWDANECPLCKQGVPINPRVGKPHVL